MLVDAVDVDEQTLVVDELPDNCPGCNDTMYCGYGLAGGGMGPYAICLQCEGGPLYKVIESIED